MSKSKIGGLISGLNKKSAKEPHNSTRTIHHSNPLFRNKERNASPIKKQMSFPAPSSPIKKQMKKVASESKSSPRSPLASKDPNAMPSRLDTPRPLANAFHQNLNETLRTNRKRPSSIHQVSSPLLKNRGRAISCYSPTPEDFQLVNAYTLGIEIPRSLPPPPKIPSNMLPLPTDMTAIPSGIAISEQKRTKIQQKIKNSPKPASIDETIANIKRKATRQMDLAVYQAIQLFCCSPAHHRSSHILKCLLQFNTAQLIQHIFYNLSSLRGKEDRRNAADTLSSLVVYRSTDSSIQKDHQLLLESLCAPANLPTLLELMKDDDIVIKSYITGVLAALHIEPSQYLVGTEANFTESSENTLSNAYSFTSIPKIIRMLNDRSNEVKEAALTAIICLGPVAAPAVRDLGDILTKEKNPQLRILACQALNEIGSPYALSAVSSIQELVRKDKEDSVRAVAQDVLDRLRNSLVNEGSASEVIGSDEHGKLFVDEVLVKKAIQECQAALKGVPVTANDLKQYFQHCYPNISRENPRWKKQLGDTLHQMVSKGQVTKNPATFTLA